MSSILMDKNTTTKLQILVEIAAGQPQIQQKDIAAKLAVTPQWVSEYITELVRLGFVVSEGRSKYRITPEGVNWTLKMMREMRDYLDMAGQAIRNITICAALADSDIAEGQEVGIYMENGLLKAGTLCPGAFAGGRAMKEAKAGEDVGVTDVTGIVQFAKGTVEILKIPGIEGGGSGQVDLVELKIRTNRDKLIGAIGIEAYVALQKIERSPDLFYGVKEAVLDAALHGLSSLVVCIDEEIADLIRILGEKGIGYTIFELKGSART